MEWQAGYASGAALMPSWQQWQYRLEDIMNGAKKIAVLGWGSLIWNRGVLSLACDWRTCGPVLPIEFSRISDDGRLTLVIDEKNGVQVPTRYALSAFDDLNSAIENLKERENMKNKNRVGYVEIASGTHCDFAYKNHPTACDSVRTWAKGNSVDAVIWAAVGPRFSSEAFSVEACVRYIERLEGEKRAKALAYIHKAPIEVITPVRAAIELRFGRPERRS